MFERIELMNMARAMTDHAARRQIVVARNIANADTPEYQARDLEGFEDSYRPDTMDEMRTTRMRHIARPDWSPAGARETPIKGGSSPNGNSVTLEEEMLKAAETKREHELSLGIYRSALDLFRTSIGGRS